MQVTTYLDKADLKRVDAFAKKAAESRSLAVGKLVLLGLKEAIRRGKATSRSKSKRTAKATPRAAPTTDGD